MTGSVVFEAFRSAAAWAPIALFAENLRSQKELISAVTTRRALSAGLTGCVRDVQQLWHVDYLELFGQSYDQRPLAVTSVRHGNVFDLANAALLEAAGLVRRSAPIAAHPKTAGAFRETVLYVSFVTPTAPAGRDAQWWAAAALSTLEIALAAATAALIAYEGLLLGTALLGCVALTQSLLLGMRLLGEPIWGNQAAVQADRALTARNGAALDVQVIADSWNATRLSVVCGYSSQLHALSNIPIRTNRPLALKWSCRALAVVLATQAALLAAVANSEGDQKWSNLLWLAFYLVMWLLKKAFRAWVAPENLLEKQPAEVRAMEPLYFSGRSAALVFISMLPVSHRENRWSWWDVFMPESTRRRSLHAQLESSSLFTKATRWNQFPDGLTGEKKEIDSSAPADAMLEEATAMMNSPACRAHLDKYLDVVFPVESPVSPACTA